MHDQWCLACSQLGTSASLLPHVSPLATRQCQWHHWWTLRSHLTNDSPTYRLAWCVCHNPFQHPHGRKRDSTVVSVATAASLSTAWSDICWCARADGCAGRGRGVSTAWGKFTLAAHCMSVSTQILCFSSGGAGGFGGSHELCDAARSGGKLGADTTWSLEPRAACVCFRLLSAEICLPVCTRQHTGRHICSAKACIVFAIQRFKFQVTLFTQHAHRSGVWQLLCWITCTASNLAMDALFALHTSHSNCNVWLESDRVPTVSARSTCILSSRPGDSGSSNENKIAHKPVTPYLQSNQPTLGGHIAQADTQRDSVVPKT